MKLNKISILILIIIFALVIRVYQLNELPSGFHLDEAMTGYHAYSILKTGRDFRGNLLPILIETHNEAMYAYLAVPFISIFDLNVFSARLAAAVIGTLTVLSTYLFAKELFNKKVGLISAFLLAVSPWHLVASRFGLRPILVPFFVTLGLFFLLKSLKNPKLFVISAFIFGLLLHTYTVTKLFVPLMLILFFLFYHKELIMSFKSNKKKCVLSIIIFLILALPAYGVYFFGDGNKRFDSISVFQAPRPIHQFFSNLLSHLSPDFLFISGDANLRHSLPGFGQAMLVLIPFILLALFFFACKQKKEGLFLVSSFVIGIIPASLTAEGIPHALRSIAAVSFLEIIAAYGIFLLYKYLKNRKKYIKTAVIIFVGLLLASNSALLIYSYFIKYPPVSEDWFQFGLREAISYAEEHSKDYDSIILTRNIEVAYVFPLFFAKLEPSEFQKSGKMGKYVICTEDINECYGYNGKNLFIVKPNELSDKDIKKDIRNKKNEVVLKIVE
jgi:4-amino-4-deoxy-L-arabinose transferase-like glycosyltransferase|tara:strand:+ start:1477 stop:2973 length:1497 start_codon:yes stop_codon:yes gene_type:complete